MATVVYPHIEFDANGVPLIRGTKSKVVDVAMDRAVLGRSADEIHEQHPHLSLGQIHAALLYYYDHKNELDVDIEKRLAEADGIRAKMESDPEHQQWRQRVRVKLDAARPAR